MNYKCRAKDPNTCRVHGTPGDSAFEQLVQQIENLPLKEKNDSLLMDSIRISVSRYTTEAEQELVNHSLTLAAYLHRDDTRQARGNLPRDPYINHPLRNTARLQKYGVSDVKVLIASILHDTIEDHSHDICANFLNKTNLSDQEARDLALGYYRNVYGEDITRIVKGVSNDLIDKNLPKEQKQELYRVHVREAINDPQVFLVKISDFVDNAVGLYHNSGSPGMVASLSRKYLPLVEDFRTKLNDPTFVKKLKVNQDGVKLMLEHLKNGEERLVQLQSLFKTSTKK